MLQKTTQPRKTQKYSGKLDDSELTGGLGMGMARGASFSGNGGNKGSMSMQGEGLFSAVTGRKRSENGSQGGSSDSQSLHSKRQRMQPSTNSNTVTVSGSAFVWGGMNDTESQIGGGNFGGNNSSFGNSTSNAAHAKAMSAMDARMSAPSGGLSTIGYGGSDNKGG